jgi:D-glycero-beta-D-manno-heptose 1-phosphate adenylyltransferase
MTNSAAKIISLPDAVQLVQRWKLQGESIVFTNGCFDIVHIGHVDYLEKARNLGGKLVLGLNTDHSIRRIKGEKRPIVEQNARARVMAALQFVDAVILFDEDTPLRLIQTIKPDILVKGNDYMPQNIIGADFVISNGGRVETIPLVERFSTSHIIEKIKTIY